MCVKLDKEKINSLLFDLSKKLNKQYKGMSYEITIVGGGSIVLQECHRETTQDIDIVKDKLLDIRQIVLELSEKYGVNHDWINDNYMFSKSYSTSYYKYRKFYKKMYNLNIYVLDLKAVACMKMISARETTNDIKDIHNIIAETGLTKDEAISIFTDLYGDTYMERLNLSLDSLFVESGNNFNSLKGLLRR